VKKLVIILVCAVLLLPLLLMAATKNFTDLVPVTVGNSAMLALIISLVVFGFHIANNRVKKLAPLLNELRSKQPVAYFCSFELGAEQAMISSDENYVTLWKIQNGEYSEFWQGNRKDVDFEPGDVNVALARKNKGLIMVSSVDKTLCVPINICRDIPDVYRTPVPESELRTIATRLKNGR
jgi:hypothetical protein